MKIDQKEVDAAIRSDEVHPHSSWMIPLAVLLVAVAIGIGVYVFLAGPTVEEVQGNIQGNTYSPTASADQFSVRIDGVPFRIPGNYTMYRRSRVAGDLDDVPMHALLPDLTPWSQADAAEFSSNAAGSRVVQFTLAVDRAPLTYEDKFERGIRTRSQTQEGVPGPYGLTTFVFASGTGYENTEWFTATLADGSRLVMRCDASANPDFGSNCMRVTRLRDNIGLTYRFKRAHLAQWQEIDARVMALIEGFRKGK